MCSRERRVVDGRMAYGPRNRLQLRYHRVVLTTSSANNFPKLHNAAWPGVVGKDPDSEPPIDLDTMLDLTAGAQVNGQKFDGVDLFLFDPHISIDISDDELKAWADKFSDRGLVSGSVVAAIWSPTGGVAASRVSFRAGLGIALEAPRGFGEQFGCHCQVGLGAVNTGVAQIGGQHRQQVLHVLALPVPRGQPLNCKGLAQVMETRLPAGLRRVADASVVPDTCEGPGRGIGRQ